MPKVQFSDVTPPDRRSIRNIPVPSSSRRAKAPAAPANPTPQEEMSEEKIEQAPKIIINKVPPSGNPYVPHPNSTPPVYGAGFNRPNGEQSYYHEDKRVGKKRSKKLIYGLLAIVVLGGFVVLMMTVFASASVAVVAKSDPIDVSLEITAARGAATSTLKYEVLKITRQKSIEVEASGEEAVERKASGKIVVYNNFSSEQQRLITRTRFETKEGLIYRIAESVVVPGKKGETPGQIEVEVFADEAGEKYNIGKTDFTVPGFKNDSARFAGFYARSTTEMQGGFIGKVKKVAESDREAAKTTLENQLKSDIQKELSNQTPEGLVALQDNILYEFKELPQEDTSKGATIKMEGIGNAIMLNESDLSNLITKTYLATAEEWQNIQAVVKDFSNLTMSQKPTRLSDGATLDLKMEGSTKAVAAVEESKIAESLTRLPRNSISEAMKSYPGVESIKATIRPVWKKAFPDNPAKIYVEISS